jgi:hypothetical protein
MLLPPQAKSPKHHGKTGVDFVLARCFFYSPQHHFRIPQDCADAPVEF